jgi:hypothetical protein
MSERRYVYRELRRAPRPCVAVLNERGQRIVAPCRRAVLVRFDDEDRARYVSPKRLRRVP